MADTRNLILAMEECGELIRACSKILRHGTNDPKYLHNLVEEIGDVRAIMELILSEHNIPENEIQFYIQQRLKKMRSPTYE